MGMVVRPRSCEGVSISTTVPVVTQEDARSGVSVVSMTMLISVAPGLRLTLSPG